MLDRDLLVLLKRHKLLALGNPGSYLRRDLYSGNNPAGWYRPMPGRPTAQEYRTYIRAAARSNRIVTVILNNPTGLFRGQQQQDEILRFIAEQIPHSRWVCVNLGEYAAASDEAYRVLLAAIKRSAVGYLFLDDTRITRGSRLKREFLDAIQHNRDTNRVLHMQLAHPDTRAVLSKGCKAWKNPSTMPRTIQRADSYRDAAEGHGHCRNRCVAPRCRGMNARGQRCCLCTRDLSGYCRHHRPRLR